MTDSGLLWRGRRWAAGVAVALAALGGLFAAAGVDVLQRGSAFATGIVPGVVTVAFSVGVLVWALRDQPAAEGGGHHSPPAPRGPAVQGATFDRLAGWRVLPPAVPAADRDRVRDRLRAAAIEAVAEDAACSRETASERVRRGDWGVDAVAAAFLGDCLPPRRIAWAERVSSRVAFAMGARATLAAIDRRTGEAEA